VKLPAYPRYKPSGVEWLGDVPEQWTPLALRRVSTRYSGGTPDRNNDSYWEDGTIPWINSGAVNQGLITNPSTFITEEAYRNSSARWVAKGSLVMALAGQGKTKGMVAQTGIATTCNQSMAAICPVPSADARYFYWLLVSQYEHIRNMAGGEQRDGLNLEILGSIPCLKPTRTEQRAIGTFLDYETERLDRLMGKKRELIVRLKEKRTALISRTVTRGLPSAVARAAGLAENPLLKLSGVDWLGDIPKHWKVAKVRHYVSILSGFAFPSAGFTRDDSDVRLLRGINIGISKIRWDDTVYWSRMSDDGLDAFELDEGTLVIGMDRPWVNEGVRVAVLTHADVPCLLLQRVAAIRPNGHLSRDYLFRILSSPMFVNYFTPEMTGVSVPHISPSQIGDFPIPVPPFPEQAAIAAYLDLETAKLDALEGKVCEAVERLQEYRTALITAAVTGKIDVRKAAA
jgi:type I restriction enzyme S subunit